MSEANHDLNRLLNKPETEEEEEWADALENILLGFAGFEAPPEPAQIKIKISSLPLRQRKPASGDYRCVVVKILIRIDISTC